MRRREAVSRRDFYELLDRWFKTTNESTVGDVANHSGVTAWVWVQVGHHLCRLHADATRDGVAQLLEMRAAAGSELEWHVVANNRGNFNKVAFGGNKQILPGVYLYLDQKVARESRL